MISLMGSERSDVETKATLSQWLLFNYGRHVLTFLGWLLALKALSLPSDRRNGNEEREAANHELELRGAAEFLKSTIPEIEVECYYLKFTGVWALDAG